MQSGLLASTAMLVVVSCCLALLVVGYPSQVRHLEFNGAHLIDTGRYNYGLTSPKLSTIGWKTLSVNGDTATIYAPTCQVSTQVFKELTGEQRKLIGDTKNQIDTIASRGNSYQGYRNGARTSYKSARFSLFSGSHSSTAATTTGDSNQISSSTTNGVESYSIGRPGMPNNLGRIFVDGDVATFVYLDGQVLMKPVACLDASEQALLAQAKLDLLQFKQNMKDMQQKMQNNMKLMQQNMQQNMMQLQQSLQQNMNGLYGGYGAAYPASSASFMTPGFAYSMPTNAYAAYQPYSPFASNYAGAAAYSPYAPLASKVPTFPQANFPFVASSAGNPFTTGFF